MRDIQVLLEVLAARMRLRVRYGADCKVDQRRPDGTGDYPLAPSEERNAVREQKHLAGTLTWVDLLGGEFDEVRAASDPKDVRAELLDMMLIISGWVEDIDRRPAAELAALRLCPPWTCPTCDDGNVHHTTQNCAHCDCAMENGTPVEMPGKVGA